MTVNGQATQPPFQAPDPPPTRAEARGRARVPRPDPPVTLQPVTLRSRFGGIAEEAASSLGGVLRGAHMTGRTKSMTQARDAVHAAANQWNSPLVKYARLAWGYGWLTLKALLDMIQVATEIPSVAIVLAVLALLTWLFT